MRFINSISFALIAATLFSSQYLMSGAEQSLDRGISRMGADILVVPGKYVDAGESVILTGRPSSFFFEDSGFGKISRIPGVAKASPQIYIATLFASCCAAPVQMIAIDSERDFTVSTWLEENSRPALGKDEIVIGSAVIQDVGKDLQFYGHTFHVVGQLDETGTGVDNSVFTRFEDAYAMARESREKAVRELVIPEGMVSAVLVRVDPGVSPDAVAARIRAEVPGTKTIMPDSLLSTVSGQLRGVTTLLYGSTAAIAIVSVPLLALIAAMAVNERKREISVFRTLGATNGFVARLMLAESFLLASIGSLAGIAAVAALLISYQHLISLTLQIPLAIPSALTVLAHGAVTLLVTIGIAGISSLYPVIRIVRSEPFEAMRSVT